MTRKFKMYLVLVVIMSALTTWYLGLEPQSTKETQPAQVQTEQVEIQKPVEQPKPVEQQKPVEQPKPVEKKVETEKRSEQEVSRKGVYRLTVEATAYSPDEKGDTGVAYDGRPAVPYKTMAVDPRVIPLGSKVYVQGYGWFLAHDTGGAVVGHIVDLRLGSITEANRWGRRMISVEVVPPDKPHVLNW